MKVCPIFALLAVAVSTMPGLPVCASPSTTPPDSFLVYKVYSIDGLIREVQQNPVIRLHYAEQFNVPDTQVVSYMRANLIVSTIPHSGWYTVYCVRKDGSFFSVKQRMAAGTRVFSLRNGEPVLKWACGNPLTKALPAVQKRTAEEPGPVVRLSPSIEMIAPTETSEVIVPTEAEPPALMPMAPVLGAGNPMSEFVAAPVVGGAGSGLGFLGPLAGLAVLFAAVDTHHGSSSPSGGTVVVPIPEGSTSVLFGVLLAGSLAVLWARSRSQKLYHESTT